MKKLTKMGVMFFVILFVLVTTYKNEMYFSVINQSDAIFTQTENEFINDWYDQNEQEQNITKNNQKNNEQSMVSNVGTTTEKEETNELDNLEIPTFTNGLQVYMFAENVMSLSNGLHIEVTGKIDTSLGVSQTVKNIRKEDNFGNLYAYSSSYGTFAKLGMEAYYNQRMLKVRKTGAVSQDLTSKFDNNWIFSSLTTYEAEYGALPNQLNYIVNQNTVLEETNFKFENGLYTFTLKLDPKLATEKYKYNIKATANSSSFPEFKSVTINVTIDQNARFKTIVYNESYKVTAYGITTQTTTNLNERFIVIDGPVTIEIPSGF